MTAAATATKRLRIATGVCLVAQRDPIQTATLVALIDHISGGRFLFGIGAGWNTEENGRSRHLVQNPMQPDEQMDLCLKNLGRLQRCRDRGVARDG